MPLDATQQQWLGRFTGGAIRAPAKPGATVADNLEDELRARQNQERNDERALKEVMLAAAFKAMEDKKEKMRAFMDFEVELRPEQGKDGSAPKPAKKSEPEKLKTRDKAGRSEKAFDTQAEGPRSKEVPKELPDAMEAMSWLVGESDKLAKPTTERSYLDEKTRAIATRKERLFTDAEIMKEMYTPLVRELVVPENFVPRKYSATQQMIDNTNDPYIEECKQKGKDLSTNKADLAKGVITLAATVTTTVLSALGPVATGMDAIKGTGTIGSKDSVSEYSDITLGVAALLTGAVDIVDQGMDYRKTGDFSTSGFQTVCNGIGVGVGKAVSGATGNIDIGLAVTAGVSSMVSSVSMATRVQQWAKNGGEFPIDALIKDMGSALSNALTMESDAVGATEPTDGTQTQTVEVWLSNAASMTQGAFVLAASAQKNHLLDSIRGGNWKGVWTVFTDAGAQAAQTAVGVVFTEKEDQSSVGYSDDNKDITYQTTDSTTIDKATATLQGLPGTVQKLGLKGLPDLPPTELEKRKTEIDKAFKAREKELANKVTGDEMKAIEKKVEAERVAFQKSLDCLGSTEPTDADFKSIAKLIEQIERDRAIWVAIATLGGAPFAVAAEFFAPLKAAGDLLKFAANLKAAIERGIALRNWLDARKDAKSAVSHYATSIENMIQNQREQITHYSIQAGLNLLKAACNAAQASPLAPAFKVAGAGVDMAAMVEDLVFKFYKQQALKAAWKQTRLAIADPDNRKLNLIVREMNPTLAKYSLAYGALIEKDTTALAAMDRCGLDRETLARANDKVGDVKNYLEKLYKDDNVVLGKIDADPTKAKLPKPKLEVKAWALSWQMWKEDDKLATANPPVLVAALSEIETFEAKGRDKLKIDELKHYVDVLGESATAYTGFVAVGAQKQRLPAVQQVVQTYRELAEARLAAVKLDLEMAWAAAVAPPPGVQQNGGPGQ